MKDLESLTQQKASIETKILDVLQDHGRQDRAFQSLKHKLVLMKDNTKRQVCENRQYHQHESWACCLRSWNFNFSHILLESLKFLILFQELVYVITENQISKYMVSIEELRGAMDQSKKELDKLVSEEESICREMQDMDVLLQKRNSETVRRGQAVHILKQKLEALKAESGVSF